MSDVIADRREFPQGLLEWAGHRSGGVRRLFYDGSGRPAGALIETPLLHRLREWASRIAIGAAETPRIIFLVGGPGNGKTEAVEETIRALERELAIDGELERIIGPLYSPTDGSTVPRMLSIDLRATLNCAREIVLKLVQDASVADPNFPHSNAAALLVDDIESISSEGNGTVYLACVNRGVLDDALIAATEGGRDSARVILEAVVRASGQSPANPACWPLSRHPEIAIWPMDVESLMVRRTIAGNETTPSPAEQVLSMSTLAERWSESGGCAAGDSCPFCRSRSAIAGNIHGPALLQILRWYELASGKRWSFRDLLSLVSYLLAGAQSSDSGNAESPCEWASRLSSIDPLQGVRVDRKGFAAPFLVVAAQYQHALFGEWPVLGRAGLRKELRELGLHEDPTLLGLSLFLSMDRASSIPGTLKSLLAGLCELLDPALADPDLEVDVSTRTKITLRELDTKFSRGVREGLQFIRKYQCLSPMEILLLSRLSDADDLIVAPETRRKRPTTAAKLSSIVRDFACRLVRRSICTRMGVVKDASTLRDFESVVDGNEQLLYQAVRQVESLLNHNDRFVVDLNTTFGEDVPPAVRRVVLYTPRQRVRSLHVANNARPAADLRFLSVGSNTASQSIPLTYELFRSVRELQSGMLVSSLPRTVKAALDATRAKLAGRVVRDDEQLDGAEIHIGVRSDVIVREMSSFIIRSGSSR